MCIRDSSNESSTGADELVMGTYSDGASCILDPQMTSSYGDWQYINQMYDTIVTTDFDGQTIKDALAESWEVSEDGLTYTFHLKDGVKFHSGKELTSEDVKWTWERWRSESGTVYSYYLDFVDTIAVSYTHLDVYKRQCLGSLKWRPSQGLPDRRCWR